MGGLARLQLKPREIRAGIPHLHYHAPRRPRREAETQDGRAHRLSPRLEIDGPGDARPPREIKAPTQDPDPPRSHPRTRRSRAGTAPAAAARPTSAPKTAPIHADDDHNSPFPPRSDSPGPPLPPCTRSSQRRVHPTTPATY